MRSQLTISNKAGKKLIVTLQPIESNTENVLFLNDGDEEKINVGCGIMEMNIDNVWIGYIPVRTYLPIVIQSKEDGAIEVTYDGIILSQGNTGVNWDDYESHEDSGWWSWILFIVLAIIVLFMMFR
jgi:hypothetical protein